MKRLALTAVLALSVFVAGGQENIHYQWLEGYANNSPSSENMCLNPRKTSIPGIPGYNAYTADLHMHTIFSDANVTPTMRVYEAMMEGIDILAITDHQPIPRRGIDGGDLNAGYNEAVPVAEKLGVKLIHGFEITGSEPIGHINVLFVNDCNDYRIENRSFTTAETSNILERATAEGAFITTNHPGWPDQNSILSDYIVSCIEKGLINGIETFNNKEFYPMAIDHALKYNLTMLATTDSHYPMNYLFDINNGERRDQTIIFAKDLSDESIKEALNARRTIAWADNKLNGRENLLLDFLHASIKVEFIKEDENFVRFRLLNISDIPYYLTTDDPQESITIPAGGYAETKRRKNLLQKTYTVQNMYVSSTGKLEIPLSFLLQDGAAVAMPCISEPSMVFGDDGLSFVLRCSSGTTHYTLDGSEPDHNSPVYNGGAIKLDKPCTFKARTFNEGSWSDTLERRMSFSFAVKCKAKKHGVHFKYYENDDILSTTHLETIGVLKKEGVYPVLQITDGIEKDHFGYIFNGFIYIPETGLYTFTLSTNDGSDLYIGGELACDNDQHNGYRSSKGSIFLQKGYHPYRVRYFEGYGGESFEIFWKKPGCDSAEALPMDEILFLD